MRKTRLFGINIGSASILLIFIVLCLVSLSILSLSSSSADQRLSKKISDREVTYFTVCNEAEKKLEAYDASLFELYQEASSKQEYLSKAKEVSWTFPITDLQYLNVTASPVWPEIASKNDFSSSDEQFADSSVKLLHFYEIKEWQVEISDQIDYDSSLNLF